MLRDKVLVEKGYSIYRIKFYVGKKKRAQLRNEENKRQLILFLKENGLIRRNLYV